MAADADRRADYYARLAARKLLPLWVETQRFTPRAPAPPYVPALWRYDELRPLLMEAGEVARPEEASRRVLVLQNPALDGAQGATRTLYACLQLILPGERQAEHRHTQSALRLVLEGDGAWTSVDGRRVPMAYGDFIVTPPWSWHGHGHDGAAPTIWLDGLDNGLVAALDVPFFEPGPAPAEPPGGERTLRWPFAAMRALLAAAPLDPCDGCRLRYLDPATGADPLATLACFAQRLPAGFRGQSHRSSAAAVFVALEGEGRTTVDGLALDWGPRDVFVVPAWAERRHEASRDAVLFSFSDRGLQEKLGLFREERGA